MKKLFVKIAFVMAGFTGVAVAQQDPQFTQFMYNKLIYNAGYAGTSGAVCGVLQYRKQWVSFDGAPTTFALSADMRLKALPIGVGITVMNDKIGAMQTNYIRLAGSYNLTKIGSGTLGLGIDAGILQKSISSDWVVPEPLKDDPRIPGTGGFGPGGVATFTNGDLNKLTYDLGLGIFYNIPGKAYIGLSSTHLPSQKITSGDLGFQVKAHYYLMAGYTFQPNKWTKITPNVLYKNDLSSSSMDANLTLLWSDKIWIGGTYRYDDAAAILAGFQSVALPGNALSYKVGVSYDFTTPKLKTYSKGSLEFILGVCFTPRIKKPTTYRNPRFLE
jgi:type IX secretion system PorP/SprF family membrane protein